MEQIISTKAEAEPEPFASIKLKQSVKDELERIQDEIKREEKLRTRPALSDVINRLIRSRPPAHETAA